MTGSAYTAKNMNQLPPSIDRAYQDLAADPRYRHFVSIPDRIIRSIDHFGVPCDRPVARARLHAYYLFIGVIDDAIDSGTIAAGRLILDDLSNPAPLFTEETSQSKVRLITAILKNHLHDEIYPVMMDRFRELYGEVIGERGASSMDSYIKHRRSVGSLTAELSYLLIRPSLSGGQETLCRFMKQVGAVGCLIDSLIDLHSDFQLGLLGFRPRVRDYAKLICCILQDGLRLSTRHPALFGVFLRAVIDNVNDLFRADRTIPEQFVSDRKDKVASVA